MTDIAPGLTSVVIVAADSGPLLRKAVAAAFSSTVEVEIVLVDNASTDGEIEKVCAEHPNDSRLLVLRNPTNLGFGTACNRGARSARGDALLFLNPDCLLEPSTIEGLRLAAADRSIGLLGVDVRAPDGVSERSNRRRDPTLRRALSTVVGLSRLASRWPMLEGIAMPAAGAAKADVESVEAVSGACMYLRRDVFDRIGGFDEGYFLHAEDLDLCRRVRAVGWDVAIVNSLRVVHAQGSSSHHRAIFVARHKHRGMWRYFVKFDPAARNPMLRGVVWLGIWSHYALRVPALWLREKRASARR